MGQTTDAIVINPKSTDANWAANNDVIPNGALVIVTSPTVGVSDQIKLGDGITPYNSLPFFNGSGGSGSGDFLGFAITSTTPPTLTENAYYYTVVHGTFTNLGGVIVPSTSLLSIISYNSTTTTWTATEVIDSSIITAQTLQQVTTAGAFTSNPFGFESDTDSSSILLKKAMVIEGTSTHGSAVEAVNNDSTVSVGVFAHDTGFPGYSSGAIVFFYSPYTTILGQGVTTGNRLIQLPDAAGTIALNNNPVPFVVEPDPLDEGGMYKSEQTDTTFHIIRVSDSRVMGSLTSEGGTPTLNLYDPTTGNTGQIFASGVPTSAAYSLPTGRQGELALAGAHINPTITTGTGAGTGAVATFNEVTSDDNSGNIALTAGTGAVAMGKVVTITFHTPYLLPPRVIVSGYIADGTFAPIPFVVDVPNITATKFDIYIPSAFAAGTNYYITYMVMK